MTRVLTRDRQRRQAEQEARGTMEAGGPYAADAQDGSELPGLEEAEGLSAGASGGREGGGPANPSTSHCRPLELGENLSCGFKPPSLG